MVGVGSYKLERICLWVRFDEFIDIPTQHPFRYHRKQVFICRNTQEGKYVWMMKSVPCQDFLAETLRGSGSAVGISI